MAQGLHYYNEFDPKTAAWLREIIRRGLLPPGDVDERSITDVKPTDLTRYTQCHFFAGIGGWSLALQLAGWPADKPVWTGSCPCQPFSSAGKQKGVKDERHLWPVFFRLIRECRPECVFGEQVASAIGHGWLDGVSADLEGEGYACGAVVLGAHSVGAPHIRQRLYWVAESRCERGEWRESFIRPPESNSTKWEQEATNDKRSCAVERVADAAAGGQRADGGASGSAGHIDERGEGIGLANPIQRGQRWGDERGLGTAGREMGEQENGPGAANQPRHGCQDAGWVGDTGGDGSAAGIPGQEPGEERQPGIADNAGCQSSRDGGGGVGNASPGASERNTRGVLEAEGGEHGAGQPVNGGGSIRPSNASNGLHAWSTAIWLPCRDGKARRVKPGLPLLAHGVPARVVRLRGYGNAIVPQVAAEFIKAFLSA